MKPPPAVFLRVAAGPEEWMALSNMKPICPLDTQLKAGYCFEMANKRYLKEGGIWISKRWDYVAFDLHNPSDEGKHTNGLAVSDSLYFCAQSCSCLTL